jgi:hypothetical protein
MEQPSDMIDFLISVFLDLPTSQKASLAQY